MSSEVEEAQEVIARLRAKRAELGDNTRLSKPSIRYRRFSRPTLSKFVRFFYAFVSGMLFSAMLLGAKTFWLLVVIIVLMGITAYRE